VVRERGTGLEGFSAANQIRPIRRIRKIEETPPIRNFEDEDEDENDSFRKKTGPVNQGVIEGPGELLIRTFADLRRLSVPACAKHEPKF